MSPADRFGPALQKLAAAQEAQNQAAQFDPIKLRAEEAAVAQQLTESREAIKAAQAASNALLAKRQDVKLLIAEAEKEHRASISKLEEAQAEYSRVHSNLSAIRGRLAIFQSQRFGGMAAQGLQESSAVIAQPSRVSDPPPVPPPPPPVAETPKRRR
jgi:septal ring factor EnvC (AmiA/AmiB activator)